MTSMAMEEGSEWLDDADPAASQQWFVRRGNRVQGPYSIRQVRRSMLLGRILPTDRVSDDGERWQALAEARELIPDEVREITSEGGWRRFVKARARVDERGPRQARELTQVERERRRADDRQYELRIRDLWLVALGKAPSVRTDSDTPRRRNGLDTLTSGVLLLVLVLVGLMLLM